MNLTETGEIACAFGEPWVGPHPLCDEVTAKVCAGVPVETAFRECAAKAAKRMAQGVLALETK